MNSISVPIKVYSDRLSVRDDFKEYFKEFRQINHDKEAILEVNLFESKRNDLDTYYKIDVLPIVKKLIAKEGDDISTEEIDFIFRNMFSTRRPNVPNNTAMYISKRFESLTDTEKLNMLSSINTWVTQRYKVQLPKIRK